MIGEKIRELRRQQNITQKDLADYLGVTPKAISFYELNQREPSNEMILLLSKKFNVSADYLLGTNFSSSKLSKLSPENKKIPIIASIKCGNNGLAYQYLEGYILVGDQYKGNLVAFRCRGDSMKDIGIAEGDIAIIRLQDDVESGELAVVVINGDEGTLKRVRKFNGGIILEAANQEYPSRIFTGNELNTLQIVGKVLEIRKRF